MASEANNVVQVPAAIASVQTPPHEGAAKRFWRILTRFDSSKLQPYLALRNTAGVVLPLIVGYGLGMPRGGLAVAIGALNVSYSDGSDAYAARARRMLLSSALCATAVFAGAISGSNHAVAVVVASLWAFVAGLVVSISTTAGDLGVISTVSLLVYAAQPLTARQAAISGVLALAGGLLQTGLSIAMWPVRRYGPERRALAGFYQELAQNTDDAGADGDGAAGNAAQQPGGGGAIEFGQGYDFGGSAISRAFEPGGADAAWLADALAVARADGAGESCASRRANP